MKVFKGVRGTMLNVPHIEVNVDTVYVRTNIKRVEEVEFSGWEYDEIQYNKNNYIEHISEKNNELEEELAEVWFDNVVKEMKITDNEQEIADLWYETIGGV